MANEFLKELAKSDVKIDRIEINIYLRSLPATKKSNAQKRWRLKEVLKRLKAVRQKQNLKHL